MSKRTFLATTLIAAVAAVPLASATTQPKLALVTKRPLVVKGMWFHAGERVTVTAMTAIGPRFVRVTADSGGSFKVSLRLPNQPCATPFAIRARGASGAVAMVAVKVTIPCTPPPVE